MASEERDSDQTSRGPRADEEREGRRTKPPPLSWPRSLAPLAVIFAFSLAIVLAILAIT